MFPLLADSTPSIGSLNSLFNPLYTKLQDMTYQVNTTLMDITYVLAFVGMLMVAYRVMMGGDLTGVGTQMVLIAMVSVGLPNFPDFIISSQSVLGPDLLDTMNMDTTSYLSSFCDKVVGQGITTTGLDAIPLFFNPLTFIFHIISMIISLIVCVMAVVVWICAMVAFVGQVVVLYVGCSILPIFGGILMFEITRETGTKYIIGLMGVLFWPLGWGVGFTLIASCDSVWSGLLNDCGPLAMLDALLGGIITATINIIEVLIMYQVVFKMPKLMQAAVVSGSQMATGLVSSAMGTAIGTATGAVGMAAGAAGSAMSMIPGPVGSMGSSAAGAVGSASSSLGSSASQAASAVDTGA